VPELLAALGWCRKRVCPRARSRCAVSS